ncbi:hypothetical protein IAT38_003492 [Cryptococcus sp. DSM 104549]
MSAPAAGFSPGHMLMAQPDLREQLGRPGMTFTVCREAYQQDIRKVYSRIIIDGQTFPAVMASHHTPTDEIPAGMIGSTKTRCLSEVEVLSIMDMDAAWQLYQQLARHRRATSPSLTLDDDILDHDLPPRIFPQLAHVHIGWRFIAEIAIRALHPQSTLLERGGDAEGAPPDLVGALLNETIRGSPAREEEEQKQGEATEKGMVPASISVCSDIFAGLDVADAPDLHPAWLALGLHARMRKNSAGGARAVTNTEGEAGVAGSGGGGGDGGVSGNGLPYDVMWDRHLPPGSQRAAASSDDPSTSEPSPQAIRNPIPSPPPSPSPPDVSSLWPSVSSVTFHIRIGPDWRIPVIPLYLGLEHEVVYQIKLIERPPSSVFSNIDLIRLIDDHHTFTARIPPIYALPPLRHPRLTYVFESRPAFKQDVNNWVRSQASPPHVVVLPPGETFSQCECERTILGRHGAESVIDGRWKDEELEAEKKSGLNALWERRFKDIHR